MLERQHRGRRRSGAGKVVAHIPVGASQRDADHGRWPAAARGERKQRHRVRDRHRVRSGSRAIAVGLSGDERLGGSAQALALSDNERALFVASAQTASVAVVQLGADSLGPARDDWNDRDGDAAEKSDGRSRVAGFVPTARYPSALAVVDGVLYVGNGKGEPPARPNAPTIAFPPTHSLRGAYGASLMRSSIRRVAVPNAARRRSRRASSPPMTDGPQVACSAGRHRSATSFIIKETAMIRCSAMPAAGDGTPADGDPSLAIRQQCRGDAARRRAPGHHAEPSRRRCDSVCSIASSIRSRPTAQATARSTDYVDKSFRWSYSGRGRTDDFALQPAPRPDAKKRPTAASTGTAADLAAFLTRFVPYKNGWRDAALSPIPVFDAASSASAIAGEFIATLSADDVAASANGQGHPTSRQPPSPCRASSRLEGHSTPTSARRFATPDAITTASLSGQSTPGLDVRSHRSMPTPDSAARRA